MSEKIPIGFRAVGNISCAGCRFLRQYPNIQEFYCSYETHIFTIGLQPALEHYRCGDHKPPVGRWELGTVNEICDE